MSSDEILTKLNVLITGPNAAGKSSLLKRFMDDVFNTNITTTIGVDIKEKTLDVDGNLVKLVIWDTAGQVGMTHERMYYRGKQGAILVYDVNFRDSFDYLEAYIQELNTYSTNSNIIKMLVGNKIDKDRVVSRDEGLQFALRHNMLFTEASAKSKEGVACAFEELVQKIIQTPGLWESGHPNQLGFTLSPRRNSNDKNPGWCSSI